MVSALKDYFKNVIYGLLSTNVWKLYLFCGTGCLGNRIKISQVEKKISQVESGSEWKSI